MGIYTRRNFDPPDEDPQYRSSAPCGCEDFPCCGHTDNDQNSPWADMSDDDIKQMVYDRNEDYDDDHPGDWEW